MWVGLSWITKWTVSFKLSRFFLANNFDSVESMTTIGGSGIFLEGGDYGNTSERSERALRGSELMGV